MAWVLVSRFHGVGFHVWVLVSSFLVWSCSVPPDRPSRDRPSPNRPSPDRPSPEPPKISLFFPSPAAKFVFSLSGGLLVEFWWCLKRHQNSTRRPPERENKFCGGRGKQKARNFGPLWACTLWAPTFSRFRAPGLHPSMRKKEKLNKTISKNPNDQKTKKKEKSKQFTEKNPNN